MVTELDGVDMVDTVDMVDMDGEVTLDGHMLLQLLQLKPLKLQVPQLLLLQKH